MYKVSVEKMNEIRKCNNEYIRKENNIYNCRINMKLLYHYHIPKYGYCLYNFNNINNNLSNGYIIVNLNDILSIKSLNEILNTNNKTNSYINIDLGSNIGLFNILNSYRENNFQVIYYLSIYNVIKYNTSEDKYIKDNLITKCNNLYNILIKYIPDINILISYQFDKFYIRNSYYNEFIDSYIKSNTKYLSVNYENNKYLVGKEYNIDIVNIHRYVNNNFLACYKNNFIFVSINNLLKNKYIINELPNELNIPNSKLSFNKASDILNIIPEKITNTLLNNKNGYINEKISLMTYVSRYYNNINISLKENNDNIFNFFKDTIRKLNNTVIIGANLDYIYDINIINGLQNIIISINKDNKDVNLEGSKSILDIVQSFSINKIKKINLINVKDEKISNTLLETINNNIVKDAYNILVNTNLTKKKFETIYKYLLNNMNCSNVYYDFEINKRLRLALGYNTYYKNFNTANNISATYKYKFNRDKYYKLRNFIKYVNNYSISNNDEVNKCCTCCKCLDKYEINYYKVKYLPYLDDYSTKIEELDFGLFL
jgi:hypothetical protein